jgi:poly(A) polymerase
MKVSTLKKFMQRVTFETELEQHRVDCLASHGDLSNWRFLKKKLKTFSQEEIKPQPLLNGRDIMALGYGEGPVIGKILKLLEEEQLERRISTREEALAWVQKHPQNPSRQ